MFAMHGLTCEGEILALSWGNPRAKRLAAAGQAAGTHPRPCLLSEGQDRQQAPTRHVVREDIAYSENAGESPDRIASVSALSILLRT
jgi:hypothetical protein